MTWNYIPPGRTGATDRDTVRYLVGDTNTDEQLVLDEEIDYALVKFPDVQFAAALVLRALAAKSIRDVNMSVGGVSVSCNQKAEGYKAMAAIYDPSGVTTSAVLVLPVFGGLSLAEKATLSEDDDAVQPFFSRTGDDIPGGPTDGFSED
jgi:hypothetical protein